MPAARAPSHARNEHPPFPKGSRMTDMNDPDRPRMKPDLPQFSGITPTDALATAVGAEGPASTRKRIVVAWGLWDWGSAAFNAVVTTFVFTVYLTSSSFGPEGTVEAQLGWALAAAGLLIAVL